MRTLRCFALTLLASAVSLLAQDEPTKKNALYGHPVQISSMVLFQALPWDLGQTWLQVDYERWLKPNLSAIGGVQYLNLYEKSDSRNESSLGFYDVLGGVRWYPRKTFSGFYLQPQLNYQRLFIDVDDISESYHGSVNRYGVNGVLGFNGKWDIISVDWNIGLCVLGNGDAKVEEYDKGTRETRTVDLEEKETDEFLSAILTPVFFTSGFAIGYLF